MRRVWLLVCCLFLIFLVACSKSSDKDAAGSGKSKTIEASVEDASYILSGADDGDNQIDTSKDRNPGLGMSVDTNNTIGSEKQKTVSVIFDVEKDKEYEINIDPMARDAEQKTEEVNVPLDTSEYNDSLETLQD